MRFATIFAVLLIGAGCSDDSPTNPQSIPDAAFSFTGSGQWLTCSSLSCIYQGDGRNTGQGCARAVSGVTRFYDANEVQLGSANSWSLAADRVVRANEAFTYTLTTVPRATADNAATYVTEASWTKVACP